MIPAVAPIERFRLDEEPELVLSLADAVPAAVVVVVRLDDELEVLEVVELLVAAAGVPGVLSVDVSVDASFLI